MEEKDLEKSNTKLIPLQKYIFHEDALDHEKKKTNRLKKSLVLAILVSLLCGYIGGSILPSSAFQTLRNKIQEGQNLSGKKIEEVLKIMKNRWFFAKEAVGSSDRLEDQALKGMTNNSEDPHTEYLTKEEMTAFNEQLKRQYVGIGVQYIQSNGKALIRKVFRNSPAEKAGIKVGDLISKVDGVSLEGKKIDELKSLVLGKEGTKVQLEVQRAAQTLVIDIVRGPVLASTYGEVIDSETGYIELFQFGENTQKEMKEYLEEFKSKNISKLVLDLRDNGGGYLTTLKYIASYFLPDNTLVMSQVYPDESKEQIQTSGQPYLNLKKLVVLVNGNTASASEVLTLALKEQRSDVMVIGTKTYGKGTVQVSQSFKDGSAIKYTTSKWVSPKGEWINGKGIEPDIRISLSEILTKEQLKWESSQVDLKVDSVSDLTKYSQLALSYLSYDPGRQDGYFNEQTKFALSNFQSKEGLEVTGTLNQKTYEALVSRVFFVFNTDKTKDAAYQKALEVLRG